MKQFKEIPIKNDIIVIASGESRNDLAVEEYEILKKKYFIIALNFVKNIIPHARMWSDATVTQYLQDTDKDCIWITRQRAINTHITKDMAQVIDYWFDEKAEKFEQTFYTTNGDASRCHWTLYWLLQLIKKYFTDKKVYLFGVDCYDDKSYIFEKGVVVHRKNSKNNCTKMPEAFEIKKAKEPKFFDNVFNCNFLSAVHCIEYKDYEEMLDG